MKHKSNSVQALRGITFLAVFFYHARLIPNGGGWGVSVFFVLSGFLLMYRNFEDNVYVSMKESILYSMNKIKKMYPLHVITMVMALPWMYFRYQGQEDIVMDIVSRIFVNVLLVQSWFPWESIRYSLNNLSWFLCCLVFMYFMFPLIHRWIKQQKSTRCIRNTVIVICVWMLLYALVIYYVFGNKDMEFVKGLTYNFPIYRLGDFTVGCLSGALCKGHVIERSFKVITIFEGIGMLIFVMMIFVDWGGVFKLRYWWEREVIFVLAATFTVWLFVRSEGCITQRLSHSLLVNIGDISAEAYLIHEVLLWYIDIFMWKILRLETSKWKVEKAVIGFILTIISVWIWRSITEAYVKCKKARAYE